MEIKTKTNDVLQVLLHLNMLMLIMTFYCGVYENFDPKSSALDKKHGICKS